jgi:hypothetical protein
MASGQRRGEAGFQKGQDLLVNGRLLDQKPGPAVVLDDTCTRSGLTAFIVRTRRPKTRGP